MHMTIKELNQVLENLYDEKELIELQLREVLSRIEAVEIEIAAAETNRIMRQTDADRL